MKTIIGLISVSNNILKDFNTQKDLFKFLAKKYKNFYIIDLNFFKLFSKKKKLKLNLPKNVQYFYPKSIFELKKFLTNKKLIAFDAGLKNIYGFSFNHYILYIIINFLGIKMVSLMNLGDEPNKLTDHTYSFNDFIRKHCIKINHIIYRFFSIFGLFPIIDLYLCSNKKVIHFIKNKFFSYRLKKIFPMINISYYRKVEYVPERELINTNIQKYLVFVDTGFHHPDREKRGDYPTYDQEEDYFNKIIFFLNLTRKYFRKKVVICLHPHSDLKFYRSKFKNFLIFQDNTDYYIARSKLCIFHASSLIYDAKKMKKNVIILKTDSLGKFWNFRTNNILKKNKINNLSLDDPKAKIKKITYNFFKNLKKSKPIYKNRNTNLLIYKKIKKLEI